MKNTQFFVSILLLCVVQCWSATLPPVWMFLSGCRGSNDKVLSNGHVYVYTDATETVLDITYSDYAGSTPNTNPIRLDAAGKAAVYSDSVSTYVIFNSGMVRQQTCIDITGSIGIQPERMLSIDGSLANSLSIIGLTPTTLVMDVPCVLTANTTVPSNVNLRFTPNGVISGAYTLTLAGSIDAGPYKIFDSTTTVATATMPTVREGVYPEWFGAVADGATDCAASLQLALDWAAAEFTVKLTNGTYKVATAVTLPSWTHIVGEGGLYGSTLLCSNNHIFEYVAIQYTTITGVNFRGSGGTGEAAIYQTGLPAAAYTESFTVDSCYFWADLEECIYANLIITKITRCVFGIFGTAGANHRHIYSQGTTGVTTNSNYLEGNRFYNSAGGESVYFDIGVGVYAQNNIWEANDSPDYTVMVQGMYTSTFLDNWFENNAGTYTILLSNDSIGTASNYACLFSGNWVNLLVANSGFVALSGASGASFRNNSGTGFAGANRVTNTNTATEYVNNHFIGYTQELTCQLINVDAGIKKGNPQCALDVYGAIASLGGASAAPNGIDVSDINWLNADTTLGSFVINGFTKGVAGQKIDVFKYASANTIEITHATGGDQYFLNPGDASIIIGIGRGGFSAVCDGSIWYVTGVAN